MVQDPSDWHLGLRAWNLGQPPKAGKALEPDEQALTKLLVHAAIENLTGALLGPQAILAGLVHAWLPNLVMPNDPEFDLTPLERRDLADLEREIHLESESLNSSSLRGNALRQGVADSVADGIVGINLVLDGGRIRGVVSTFWAINAAARCGFPLAPRERLVTLRSFAKEVLLATESGLDSSRLSRHINAEIKKGLRR